MKIYRTPWHENDGYYFAIEPFDSLAPPLESDYYWQKRHMFLERLSDKKYMENFLDRSSFTGHQRWKDIEGSVYTLSAIHKNGMTISGMAEEIRERKNKSRRCVIRLADPFCDYMDDDINTSCLNIIHFFDKKVTLFFRASDMRYELLIDLHLIKEFFIDPVFIEEKYTIEVIASTAQNIVPLKTLIK